MSQKFKKWLPYLMGVPSFEGIRISCREQGRRYPGLHPGGREQGEGHGGELPHLAASVDEENESEAQHEGGEHLDYHHLNQKHLNQKNLWVGIYFLLKS